MLFRSVSQSRYIYDQFTVVANKASIPMRYHGIAFLFLGFTIFRFWVKWDQLMFGWYEKCVKIINWYFRLVYKEIPTTFVSMMKWLARWTFWSGRFATPLALWKSGASKIYESLERSYTYTVVPKQIEPLTEDLRTDAASSLDIEHNDDQVLEVGLDRTFKMAYESGFTELYSWLLAKIKRRHEFNFVVNKSMYQQLMGPRFHKHTGSIQELVSNMDHCASHTSNINFNRETEIQEGSFNNAVRLASHKVMSNRQKLPDHFC